MLAVAVVLAFAANKSVPGDPVLMMLGDQSGNVDLARKLRSEYGLDRPVLVQFFDYAGGLLRGDLGLSFRFPGVPVAQVIADGLWISPLLAIGALTIAFPIGVAVGIFAAIRRNTLADVGVMRSEERRVGKECRL